MGEGSLSQDEIDALLGGTGDLLGEKSSKESGSSGDFDLTSLLGETSTTSSPTTTSSQPKKVKETISPIDPNNLELLLDAEMKLTVELGRTKMSIKDILNIGEGAVIELDKLYGEPVDILVNDKIIARGEIVIVNEDFGIKVTEFLNPKEKWPGFMKKK